MKRGSFFLIACNVTWPLGIFAASSDYPLPVRAVGVLVMFAGMLGAAHLSLDARN